MSQPRSSLQHTPPSNDANQATFSTNSDDRPEPSLTLEQLSLLNKHAQIRDCDGAFVLNEGNERSQYRSPLHSVKSFEELKLEARLLKGIYNMGFSRPSRIQERALPQLLAYPPRNMIAQSQNGTGKTVRAQLNPPTCSLQHPLVFLGSILIGRTQPHRSKLGPRPGTDHRTNVRTRPSDWQGHGEYGQVSASHSNRLRSTRSENLPTQRVRQGQGTDRAHRHRHTRDCRGLVSKVAHHQFEEAAHVRRRRSRRDDQSTGLLADLSRSGEEHHRKRLPDVTLLSHVF